MLLCLCSVFFITFVVFPGVFVQGTLKMSNDDFSWFLIIILFTFNLADTFGRTLGGRFNLSEKAIASLAIMRLLFIPSTILTVYYDT